LLDHVDLRAKDLEKTTKFYATVLAPIGYVQKQDGDTKGFGDETSYDFFIVKGDPSDSTHCAFRCPDRKTVKECWGKGSAFGAQERPPALMPKIHPNYYASFLIDPDGRLVEFVCHDPE
jgi:catechol 2,3-dioxygenase-like lactoylglutathione lyase family enzyme